MNILEEVEIVRRGGNCALIGGIHVCSMILLTFFCSIKRIFSCRRHFSIYLPPPRDLHYLRFLEKKNYVNTPAGGGGGIL